MLAMQAKRRSGKKGLPFDLTSHIDELEMRVQSGLCEMTGLPLNMHNKGISWNSPSLHRIVPGDGYVYSNIRIVCFAINAAMGNWGEAALLEVVSAWLERRRLAETPSSRRLPRNS